jgi:hypothetical protein
MLELKIVGLVNLEFIWKIYDFYDNVLGATTSLIGCLLAATVLSHELTFFASVKYVEWNGGKLLPPSQTISPGRLSAIFFFANFR